MKLLVTGASSFLGHHVMPKLRGIDGVDILAPSSSNLNLLNYSEVIACLLSYKPDTILHMAAKCGGIGANKENPAVFIHDNLKMMSNLFDGIRNVNRWEDGKGINYMRTGPTITHFYGLGSVCGFPKFCPVPFKEEDLWNGRPEETNHPYGESKRVMLLMQQTFRQQFGLKGAHLIPVNMFAEHDHFDPRNSHVIPALIRKFVEGKNSNSKDVQIWGDGTPTREFLYAGDCADAIVKVVSTNLDYEDPINIGTGRDISIKDLAILIKEIVGYEGSIIFDGNTSVNGQPKRRLDVSIAKQVLGFEAKTSLREGIEKTVSWFLKNQR